MAFIFRSMCVLSCLAHFSCGEDAIEPRFSVIQEKIFTPSCAFSSCHDAVSPENELDLTKDNAYTSLMQGASPDTYVARVVAGEPDKSLLYLSLVGQTPEDIRAMPLGGVLDQSEIDAIKAWINEGALDN